MSEFLWVTTDTIQGRRIVRTLGGVRGNAIRARHIGRDILAALKGLVGGEIHDYTALLAQAREQSLDRMFDEARQLGANAVVEVRFASAEVAKCAAEILAYGTAVVVEDEE
ncbi:MAG: YbjQ family protein [Planctomycetota bacterium]